jgi:hypothetical protein
MKTEPLTEPMESSTASMASTEWHHSPRIFAMLVPPSPPPQTLPLALYPPTPHTVSIPVSTTSPRTNILPCRTPTAPHAMMASGSSGWDRSTAPSQRPSWSKTMSSVPDDEQAKSWKRQLSGAPLPPGSHDWSHLNPDVTSSWPEPSREWETTEEQPNRPLPPPPKPKITTAGNPLFQETHSAQADSTIKLDFRILSFEILDEARVPWIRPPPIAKGAKKAGWTFYILESHPTTHQQILKCESAGSAKGYTYKYYDRNNQIGVCLDEVLLVPPSLLDVDRFGIPFPDIECILEYQNKKSEDKPGRKGKWLYLVQKPNSGDEGKQMEAPDPSMLPMVGSPWKEANPVYQVD